MKKTHFKQLNCGFSVTSHNLEVQCMIHGEHFFLFNCLICVHCMYLSLCLFSAFFVNFSIAAHATVVAIFSSRIYVFQIAFVYRMRLIHNYIFSLQCVSHNEKFLCQVDWVQLILNANSVLYMRAVALNGMNTPNTYTHTTIFTDGSYVRYLLSKRSQFKIDKNSVEKNNVPLTWNCFSL